MTEARSPGTLARLILVPLRLATGWGRAPRQLGMVGILTIILLRLCIGFHFYSEGVDKLSSDFDAGQFFSNSRGPMAGFFQRQVWDWDGNVRLDRERTLNFWGLSGQLVAEAKRFQIHKIKKLP